MTKRRNIGISCVTVNLGLLGTLIYLSVRSAQLNTGAFEYKGNFINTALLCNVFAIYGIAILGLVLSLIWLVKREGYRMRNSVSLFVNLSILIGMTSIIIIYS